MLCGGKGHLPIHRLWCIPCPSRLQPMSCTSWLLQFKMPLRYFTFYKMTICVASKSGRITALLPLFSHHTSTKLFGSKRHRHHLWRGGAGRMWFLCFWGNRCSYRDEPWRQAPCLLCDVPGNCSVPGQSYCHNFKCLSWTQNNLSLMLYLTLFGRTICVGSI